jgi:hypothetical protein
VFVNQEEQIRHVALPKLRGQPAYARPSRPVKVTARPFDPDDLPIVAEMSEEDLALAAQAVPRPHPGLESMSATTAREDAGRRQFRLRTLAGRILGGNE